MKSIFSILVAVIFTLSQVGYSISTHFCGGEISDRSIGFAHSDLNCGMESDVPMDCAGFSETIKSNCCNDDLKNFIVVDNFKTQTENIGFDKDFSLAVVVPHFNLISFQVADLITKFDFKPPPLKQDIPVLIQSFLI